MFLTCFHLRVGGTRDLFGVTGKVGSLLVTLISTPGDPEASPRGDGLWFGSLSGSLLIDLQTISHQTEGLSV